MRPRQKAFRVSWSTRSLRRGRGHCAGGVGHLVGTVKGHGTFCMSWRACGTGDRRPIFIMMG
eukprot:3902690-Pyramimonas_sp.AAC.1